MGKLSVVIDQIRLTFSSDFGAGSVLQEQLHHPRCPGRALAVLLPCTASTPHR